MTVRKGSKIVCQKMSGTTETCGVTHDSLAAKEEDKKVNALSEGRDVRVENFVGKNFALEGLSHNYSHVEDSERPVVLVRGTRSGSSPASLPMGRAEGDGYDGTRWQPRARSGSLYNRCLGECESREARDPRVLRMDRRCVTPFVESCGRLLGP